MKRLRLFTVLAFVVSLPLAPRTVGATVTPVRPNFVFLLTDNQPPETIRALGNPYIETPHLDRLVNEGATFTRAIAANPHCIPSRAEILSGATGFTNLSSPFGNSLNERLTLWPAAMKAAGYHTWYCGKWHTAGTPAQRGYEETRGLRAPGRTRTLPQTYPNMR